MYFKDVKELDIANEVNNLDKLYAHLKEANGVVVHRELLENHMDLSMKYFNKLYNAKNLENVFRNFQDSFFNHCSVEAIELWKELIYNTIYSHDLGKSNPNFQSKQMRNSYFQMTESRNTKHSLISSCIYFNHYFEKVMKFKVEERNLLLLFLTINSFIISKHHGALDTIEEFIEKLEDGFKSEEKEEFSNYKGSFSIVKKIKLKGAFRTVIEGVEKKNKWKSVDLYIYTRFIYGLLVSCDFYATSHYQNNKEVEDLGVINNIDKYYAPFKNTGVCKSINQYKEFLNGEGINPFGENDINELRTEMFLESESNLLKNIEEDIFFLEAPTGSGKTNSSINLAFRILENDKKINKIFYVFPFNTLVEQTKDSLMKVFEGFEDIKNEVAVINSITPIKEFAEENMEYALGKGDKTDYEKSLLARQFLHYPITLSTHVNLFNCLFGIDRESVFPLAHMANSVLILDEIQSYRNEIWKEIIIFLKAYAKLLNMKIIIMSATLPNLANLSHDKEGFSRLIVDRDKYFSSRLFKNRVDVDFSLLQDNEEEIENLLFNKVIEKSIELGQYKQLDGKIVVEFIKKASALKFYNRLNEFVDKEDLGKEVLLITGDDNKIERKNIIERVKKNKNVILVATQVIEAGVDIDMDIGFKDIGMLDGEEQFLGRINRSCKKDSCKVYFFNMDDASMIYRNDFRKMKDLILLNKDIQEILQNKNFDLFYEKVMERLEKTKGGNNQEVNIDVFREQSICRFNFEDIEKRMQLIIDDRRMYTVFLNREITMDDGSVIYGKDVWDRYYELLINKELGYAERKVKLSEVAEKMDYFTYQVDKKNFNYNDVLGDMFYIEDGDKYFENGKFNKELLQKCESYEFC